MATRKERVVVTSERYRITAMLTLPADGYLSRMSDYLNASERHFIAMTDVEIEGLEGDDMATHRDFVAVSRRHIVPATPADEPSLPPAETRVAAGSANEARA